MCGLNPATQNTAFSLTGNGFVGVNVSLSCTYTVHDETTGGNPFNNPFNVYFIVSTATYGNLGDVDYAERRLEASVSNRYQ